MWVRYQLCDFGRCLLTSVTLSFLVCLRGIITLIDHYILYTISDWHKTLVGEILSPFIDKEAETQRDSKVRG